MGRPSAYTQKYVQVKMIWNLMMNCNQCRLFHVLHLCILTDVMDANAEGWELYD